MFEVIQSDGQIKRYGDEFSWEYHAELTDSGVIEDRSIVRIVRSDDDSLVTTFFRPIRVDEVDENTCLHPEYKTRIGTKCHRCGHVEY